MFTNQKGVWEAPSAFAWEKLCAEVDVRFMQTFSAEKLFTEASAADIDEFGLVMLGLTFGKEE